MVNLNKLTYASNLESLAEVSDSERYAFEQVDICNRPEVDRVLAQHKPGAIMHLAAESHVDSSIDGPDEFIETNIVGTYTLLEACRQCWQSLDGEKKPTFVSTTSAQTKFTETSLIPVIMPRGPSSVSCGNSRRLMHF